MSHYHCPNRLLCPFYAVENLERVTIPKLPGCLHQPFQMELPLLSQGPQAYFHSFSWQMVQQMFPRGLWWLED